MAHAGAYTTPVTFTDTLLSLCWCRRDCFPYLINYVYINLWPLIVDRLTPVLKMATNGNWQTTVGTIASTAGLTGFAVTGVQGVIAGYQAFVSPYGPLTRSERKLKRVKSRLQELSPQQREEIEIAARSGSSEFTSLEHLEKQLADLLTMHCKMSKRCEEMTLTERHYPLSEFRRRLSRFEELAKELLNDTFATTASYLNDTEFDSKISTRAIERPSSSESTSIRENSKWTMNRSPSSESRKTFKTARESLSDLSDGGIPLSRMV